jgi:hypothetical protein
MRCAQAAGPTVAEERNPELPDVRYSRNGSGNDESELKKAENDKSELMKVENDKSELKKAEIGK